MYMSVYQQKKIWKIIKYSKLTGVIFVCIAVYFIIQSLQFLQKWDQLKVRLSDARKEQGIYDAKLAKRQGEYTFLKTDRGQEEYLRNNMPVAKDGEKVIILYDPTSSAVQMLSTDVPWYVDAITKIKYFFATYTNI